MNYLKRIVDLKKENLITYNEFGDCLLGDKNCYSSDNLRKAFYVIEKIINNLDSDYLLTDDEMSMAIDKKMEELRKERYKNQAINVEKFRRERQESRFALFYEQVADVIKTLTPPQLICDKWWNLDSDDENEYVLTISDIHYGANFDSQNNYYNTKECQYRFRTLLDYISEYCVDNDIHKLKIIGLGDSVQGILRMSDLKLNESSVVQAVVEVSQLIAEFLNQLSAVTNVEYYHSPTANHSQSRPLGTKASEIATEDVEYIIGNYIKDVLVNNDRVSVYTNFGKDYIKIPIFNFNAIAMHGHTVKNMDSVLKDLSMLHHVFYDYIFLGHFHNGKEIPSGESYMNDTEILVSPSIVGSDPYSDVIMKGSQSACKLYEFDKINGHIGTKKFILN